MLAIRQTVNVGSGSQAAFAWVEPHASFTFTNRHSPEQQVAALGPLLIDVGSLSVF